MVRRWWRSCVAGGVAGLSLAAFAIGTAAPRPQSMAPEGGPTHADVACAVPADWPTFPVVDHFDPARGKPSTVREGAFNELAATTAPLGDVFVRFQADFCWGGGSACAGAPRTLHHVRVGPIDESGAPLVGSSFRCVGTPPREPGEDALKRSCSPSSLTLRRAPDGRTFVLTVRDPDPVETPISAFARSPAALSRSRPPLRRGIDWQLLVGIALLGSVVGAHRLRAAWRFVCPGGILSWRDAVVANGKLEASGETPLAVRSIPPSFTSTVLFAPSMLGAASYRTVPSVDVHQLFLGSRAEAEEQVRKALTSARVSFALTAAVSVVGFVAYRGVIVMPLVAHLARP